LKELIVVGPGNLLTRPRGKETGKKTTSRISVEIFSTAKWLDFMPAAFLLLMINEHFVVVIKSNLKYVI